MQIFNFFFVKKKKKSQPNLKLATKKKNSSDLVPTQ